MALIFKTIFRKTLQRINNDFRTDTHIVHGTANHSTHLLFQPQLKGDFLSEYISRSF